jgi:hypothetical protein
MWPFILTRSVTLHKNIQASKAEALSVVQDPEEILRLNSLATSVVQDVKDPAWYTVTERLPILGGLFESSTKYRCRWEKVEGGADADVYAAAGVRLKNEMRVLDSEEGGVKYHEVVVVKAPFFLMPYTASTMTKAHTTNLDLIANRIMQKRGATTALNS